MPSDTQTIAGAILTGMGAIGLAIRWSVGRLAKSQDRAITALIENARSHATLATKFDTLMTRFEGLTARFDHIVEALLRTTSLGEAKAKLATKQKSERRKESESGERKRDS